MVWQLPAYRETLALCTPGADGCCKGGDGPAPPPFHAVSFHHLLSGRFLNLHRRAWLAHRPPRAGRTVWLTHATLDFHRHQARRLALRPDGAARGRQLLQVGAHRRVRVRERSIRGWSGGVTGG